VLAELAAYHAADLNIGAFAIAEVQKFVHSPEGFVFHFHLTFFHFPFGCNSQNTPEGKA